MTARREGIVTALTAALTNIDHYSVKMHCNDKLHSNKPGFVTSLNYTTQVLHHQKKNVILRTTYLLMS